MWRIAISVVLGSILLGCSKQADEKPLEEKDAHAASASVQSDLAVPPAPVVSPEEAKGTIVGKAADGRGEGVDDVKVGVYRTDRDTGAIATATTAADGRFTIKNMPVGDGLVVKAVKKKSLFGVHGEKQHVSVQAGTTVDIGNIELKISLKSKPQK